MTESPYEAVKESIQSFKTKIFKPLSSITSTKKIWELTVQSFEDQSCNPILDARKEDLIVEEIHLMV